MDAAISGLRQMAEKDATSAPAADTSNKTRLLQLPKDDLNDHYSLGPQLGEGFSGIVRLAEDLDTGELVACKSIPVEKLKHDSALKDLRAEIRAMQRVAGHPNVVELKGTYEDKASVHLLLDLCKGGDVFDYLANHRRLEEAEIAKIFWQVTGALRHCHALGIVHRDVKPENLLISSMLRGPDGVNRPLVKLADFGLAARMHPGQPLTGLAGSPVYVAPEILRRKLYGSEVDMWSLGVALYVALSGFMPYWGRDNKEILSCILRREPDYTNKPWPSISKEAKDLVRSLLVVDPRGRLTARSVLHHPWMTMHCKIGSDTLPSPRTLRIFPRSGSTGSASSPMSSPTIRSPETSFHGLPPSPISPFPRLPQWPKFPPPASPVMSGELLPKRSESSCDVEGKSVIGPGFKVGNSRRMKATHPMGSMPAEHDNHDARPREPQWHATTPPANNSRLHSSRTSASSEAEFAIPVTGGTKADAGGDHGSGNQGRFAMAGNQSGGTHEGDVPPLSIPSTIISKLHTEVSLALKSSIPSSSSCENLGAVAAAAASSPGQMSGNAAAEGPSRKLVSEGSLAFWPSQGADADANASGKPPNSPSKPKSLPSGTRTDSQSTEADNLPAPPGGVRPLVSEGSLLFWPKQAGDTSTKPGGGLPKPEGAKSSANRSPQKSPKERRAIVSQNSAVMGLI
eukprot:TRINITY_DN16712_c0_g1_i1.p1 TRINITY_DN16712_c0_g1~~TRINITY_DN16712_c0_g1_i1.p1  ORF type:complete len:683 (+),score=102.30 TRINITY_DN16712_c0_g1_i1:566-2614(+)